MIGNATTQTKTVASPNQAYDQYKALWEKCRAVCDGERFVKAYDSIPNPSKNLLIPFSPTMDLAQYNFYKSEAEFPGIVSQYIKMIVGALLRKAPVLEVPEGSEEAKQWLLNEFGQDDSPMTSFLENCLHEELRTSRCWVMVDHPRNDTGEEIPELKPYPILLVPEKIINWHVSKSITGKMILDRLIIREEREVFKENEFHPSYVDTVYVHEVVNGVYGIRVFEKQDDSEIKRPDTKAVSGEVKFELVDEIEILVNGNSINFIPAWPLNGTIDCIEPVLTPLIDKEVALYNKVSRRNHLLYGAATYTPIVAADMTEEDFDAIVSSGLGSWIKLPMGGTVTALETPTAALADMDRSIAAAIEEMAKLGIRMLSPEMAQSGIALELRNAAQTAQLGSLNLKISNIIKQVLIFMIRWKYDIELKNSDITFTLSSDFTEVPLMSDWMTLATDWYQQGLIPRSIWVSLLKRNEILPQDYDDKQGQTEITEDGLLQTERRMDLTYGEQVFAQQRGLVPAGGEEGGKPQ
jgi:hypothetical protein